MPLKLAADPRSIRIARHWVLDRAVTAGVPAPMVPVVELLATELVTNAILHGSLGQPITVTTCLTGRLFGLAVKDLSPDQPVLRQPDPSAPGGRGVMLVDMLSTNWGVEVLEPTGKSVWFRLTV